MLTRFPIFYPTLAGLLLWRTTSAWACSVCFGQGDDAAGYNASVLFLMAMPYLVFGAIIGGLIFTYRRALKRSEQEEPVESDVNLSWNQEETGR